LKGRSLLAKRRPGDVRQGSGKIINMSSHGQDRSAADGNPIYCMTRLRLAPCDEVSVRGVGEARITVNAVVGRRLFRYAGTEAGAGGFGVSRGYDERSGIASDWRAAGGGGVLVFFGVAAASLLRGRLF